MKTNNNYQALHSPVAANAGFAVGIPGQGGGFMNIDAFVPNQDIFIGTFCDETITMLPYFSKATSDYRESFVKSDNAPNPIRLNYYSDDQIKRTYGPASDLFDAENGTTNIKLELFSPGKSIPDASGNFDHKEMKFSLMPSIITTLTIDNSRNSKVVKGFFAVGGLKGLVFYDGREGLVGVKSINGYGFATKSESASNLQMACDFDPFGVFGREKPVINGVAPVPMLIFDVPANAVITVEIALAWYNGGCVTHGANRCKFFYTHFFSNIEEVFTYSLENASRTIAASQTIDQELQKKRLSEAREFLVSHSVHSYYVSTMLFDDEHAKLGQSSKPRWCVNEGSFMMMNTFDLAVDHSFYELATNPWVVRNLLDFYVSEYSYEDTLHSTDDAGNFLEGGLPGGISFSHDHGTHNTFTPRGNSSYEVTNQDGCFSYMTQEQLCNWVILAGLYVQKTGDHTWLSKNSQILEKCLTSLLNRDANDLSDYDGVMDLDSDRCGKSSEITTYDSIDHSLGQSRRNLYVATKCWSSYLILSHLFELLTTTSAAQHKATLSNLGALSHSQARKCAGTIVSYFNADLGIIPALLDGKDQAAIIPAIEALGYPFFTGSAEAVSPDGEFAKLISILRTHTTNVLKLGICIFDDGGWKLTSKNSNSWISKIFLCQFSSESILKFAQDSVADEAHVNWWKVGCIDCPGIDQIHSGSVTEHGFHYPRAVASYVWIYEV